MALCKGQRVVIVDTANDRRREGTVEDVDGNDVRVMVHRFNAVFLFRHGKTPRERFVLTDETPAEVTE